MVTPNSVGVKDAGRLPARISPDVAPGSRGDRRWDITNALLWQSAPDIHSVERSHCHRDSADLRAGRMGVYGPQLSAAWIAVSTSDTQTARSLLTFCLS
jgi:hypothetical protein